MIDKGWNMVVAQVPWRDLLRGWEPGDPEWRYEIWWRRGR